MKSLIYVVTMALFLSVSVGFAQDASKPDVQEIVKKANLVAYYQGDDGKARVTMTITPKQGPTRKREFNILRKDVTDGGDQNYYVYFFESTGRAQDGVYGAQTCGPGRRPLVVHACH